MHFLLNKFGWRKLFYLGVRMCQLKGSNIKHDETKDSNLYNYSENRKKIGGK